MKREIGYIALLAVAFFFGYKYASSIYGEQIAELREDYARRLVELQEEYRAKEQYAVESMRLAWEQRDAAYARLRERGAELERVRNEASSARNRLSRTTKDSCHAEREQLARCAALLERGCGLLERGVDLSAKSAIDKDAIVKMVNY